MGGFENSGRGLRSQSGSWLTGGMLCQIIDFQAVPEESSTPESAEGLIRVNISTLIL